MAKLLVTVASLRPGGEAALERYAHAVLPLLQAAGAEVLTRASPTETLIGEGNAAQPDLVAVMRFPDGDAVRNFLNSAAYRAAEADRREALHPLHSYLADDLMS